MRISRVIAPMVLAAIVVPVPSRAQEAANPTSPTVTAIMVHGNHTTPDADVLRIAGVQAGQPFTPTTVAEVTRRLDASGRFRSVDVRHRFTSFSDPDAVLLVIVVEERVGVSLADPTPSPLKRFGASTMWLPVFSFEDGYGLSYGVRFGFVDLIGRSTRVSVPLTWGAERRASVLVERTFARGPLSRVEISGGTWRREFPPTGEGQRRDFAAARVERAIASWLRVGGRGEIANVSLGAADDRVRTAGVDAVVDTRRDPAFPRNAVYASVAWERLWFDAAPDASRASADVRGYLGLPGQVVLVGRVLQSSATEPLPAFEQQLLGGSSSLRGFRLGYRSGDRLTAGSVELRLPFTSPLRIGRFGLAVFADRGAVYDVHTPWRSAGYDTGVGAGIFVTLPVVSFRVDVAHGLDAGTRAHVGFGVRF